MNNDRKILTVLATLLFACFPAGAQKVSLETNILDYVNLGTLNLESSFALSRHWSLGLEAKYNPFVFKGSEGNTFQRKQRSLAIGGRWWAWHVWSGWWTSAALRYQEYSNGNLRSQSVSEGDRLGTSLSAGYAYMLSPHLNLDFSLGFFMGYDSYTKYSCPVCGLTLEGGSRFFILPDKVMVALNVIF